MPLNLGELSMRVLNRQSEPSLLVSSDMGVSLGLTRLLAFHRVLPNPS